MQGAIGEQLSRNYLGLPMPATHGLPPQPLNSCAPFLGSDASRRPSPTAPLARQPHFRRTVDAYTRIPVLHPRLRQPRSSVRDDSPSRRAPCSRGASCQSHAAARLGLRTATPMTHQPPIGAELSLMSGQFFGAARVHLDSTRQAEAAIESMRQAQFALSGILCAVSALDAVSSEAMAVHGLNPSQPVATAILALGIAAPIVELLKFVSPGAPPTPADTVLQEVYAAYYLRNKFVHYEAEWARAWPPRLLQLGIASWTPRDPLLGSSPGQAPPVRPQFPDDVLCSEGLQWIIKACSSFLQWWASSVGRQPWWQGRNVPTKLLTVRIAPHHP